MSFFVEGMMIAAGVLVAIGALNCAALTCAVMISSMNEVLKTKSA
jgi:hypothetical protein